SPPGIQGAEVPAGDAEQRHEVVGVPEPVPIGLTEADAAAQERPVEASRVDLDRRRQVGSGVSEREPPAVRFDQLQAAASEAGEGAQDESPGGCLDRGHRTAAYSGNACSHGKKWNPPTLGCMKVKVCGMTSLADAEHAAAHGAWAIGLI